MHYQQTSTSRALAGGSARMEQWLRRLGAALGRVPLGIWRTLIILLLVIWLTHTLARLFWLAVPPPQIPAADISANVVASGTGSSGARALDIASLRELNIFGRSSGDLIAELPEPETVTDPLVDEAVDTQLKLVLRGVIGSTADEDARAIIADSNEQKIYSVGDELPGGRAVTLAKVLDTRVILNNDGRYESLWLYAENPNIPTASQTAPTATQIAQDEDTRGRSWVGDDEAIETSSSPATPSNQRIRRAVQRRGEPETEQEVIAEASRTLSDVVSMNIHREDGQVVGYRIRPGRDAEQFNALGLQADDVVTAVNGMPLNNPGNLMEIYRNMSDATSASLEIDRDGQTITVDISLD